MNSTDPRSMRTPPTRSNATAEEAEIAELAPSEELMLRVEQIFEEAEELWVWMYNDWTSTH